jgi:hypothetical protein
LSGDSSQNRSSLFGLVDFRPRLAVVLVILTLTVAVVGFRISRDSGSGRMEGMGREALRIFMAVKDERGRNAAPHDPAEIEERVRGWIGVKVALPRDEKSFSSAGVTREKIGKQTAAAIRLAFSGEPYLLMIRRREAIRGTESPSALSSGSSFLSWEKEGISFVFWERDGVQYLLVSDVDLTHTFDLVRQYFT